MAVKLISITTLKPNPALSFETNNLIPLSAFDLAAPNLHVASLYAFHPPTPTNTSLKCSLTGILSHFPHLAGRLISNRFCISLDNSGVCIVETEVSASLSEMLPLEALSNLSDLHPPIGDVPVDHLLQIQLNRYACGGLVIGATAHHRVADGQSMSFFFTAWAKLARVGTAPNPPPFLNRAEAMVPRTPLTVEFNHREIEFRSHSSSEDSAATATCAVENLKVHFSKDFIAELKSFVPGRCSTFEVLLAHLWRKISKARGLRANVATKVRVAVNGRFRMKPPVPMEFFGNMVLWAHPKATVGELTAAGGSGLAYAVGIIHGAVKRIDDRYFRSFVDFGEGKRGKEEELAATAPVAGNVLCPNLEVDSWLSFNFHELDFGSGAPCAFLPPNLPVEGLMIFVPSMKEKGGVDVFMALAVEHVDAFRKICYSLD